MQSCVCTQHTLHTINYCLSIFKIVNLSCWHVSFYVNTLNHLSCIRYLLCLIIAKLTVDRSVLIAALTAQLPFPRTHISCLIMAKVTVDRSVLIAALTAQLPFPRTHISCLIMAKVTVDRSVLIAALTAQLPFPMTHLLLLLGGYTASYCCRYIKCVANNIYPKY